MITSELRDVVLQFVDSSISIEALEDWIVPKLPLFLRFPDSEDAKFVAAIELGLAEISAEILTVDEFRSSIETVLLEQSGVLVFYPENQSGRTVSSSSNKTIISVFPSGENIPLVQFNLVS